MKCANDLLGTVRLWKKTPAVRQVTRSHIDKTGGRNNVDWRPPVSYRPGKLQPIHGSRHLDIGKHNGDVQSCFEYRNGFVGV
jgi:hypothetical protein